MRLDRFSKHTADLGLLLLRVGLGASMMWHGWPKLIKGPERWARLADSVGIGVMPEAFGLFAAVAELVGGLLFALGLGFRPACVALLLTMIGAFASHLRAGEGFGDFSHALELAFVFVGLFFVGPGRYSLNARLPWQRARPHKWDPVER